MRDIVSEEQYSELLALQERLNSELKKSFEAHKSQGRERLAKILVDKVEEIVQSLNSQSYGFELCEYAGDVNYENSEQIFSNGEDAGTGTVLHFHGFSVQVTWEGRDKYA